MAGHLSDLLFEVCRRFGPREAMWDREERLRYADLDRAATDLLRPLQEAGAALGEPVLVPVSNRARDLAAFLAVWGAGGIVVPVHRRAAESTARALCDRTGARFVANGRPDLPLPAALPGGRAVARCSQVPPPARPLLADAALIVFTSGSTGEPKGVVLSHARIAAKLETIDAMLRFGDAERTLLVLQLGFSFGQWVTLLTLLRGGTLLMHEKFEPSGVPATLARERVTRIGVVPTMLRAMLPLPDASATDFAGAVMAGGEPLPASLGGRLRSVWPAAALWDIYGLTETGTCDFFVRADEYDEAAGTIGRPAPNVAWRLGAEGELQIRTPYGMLGYLDAPDSTAAAYDEGWLRTGDLARQRADGRVELIGRARELILRAGNKVAPLEVERVFLDHPDVLAALAAGIADARLGEAIHLFLVLRPGAAAAEARLRDWAGERIERWKLPDRIHFGRELPVGGTGKADRRVLAQLAAGAQGA